MTSHKPFRIPDKSQELVLDPEGTNLFGDYLPSIRYADHALGEFLQALRDADLYSNSIILIYGDHHGIGTENRDALQSMERLLGQSYVAETMLSVPLIVHIPGIGEQYDIRTTGGHLDLLPTLLNVLGIENTYLTLGRDLLHIDSRFAVFQAYVEPKSFVDGQDLL